MPLSALSTILDTCNDLYYGSSESRFLIEAFRFLQKQIKKDGAEECPHAIIQIIIGYSSEWSNRIATEMSSLYKRTKWEKANLSTQNQLFIQLFRNCVISFTISFQSDYFSKMQAHISPSHPPAMAFGAAAAFSPQTAVIVETLTSFRKLRSLTVVDRDSHDRSDFDARALTTLLGQCSGLTELTVAHMSSRVPVDQGAFAVIANSGLVRLDLSYSYTPHPFDLRPLQRSSITSLSLRGHQIFLEQIVLIRSLEFLDIAFAQIAIDSLLCLLPKMQEKKDWPLPGLRHLICGGSLEEVSDVYARRFNKTMRSFSQLRPACLVEMVHFRVQRSLFDEVDWWPQVNPEEVG